jgi:superoxide reductase
MSEAKFYRCAHCGNLITFLNNAGVPVVCCGEKMQQLIPNSTDAAQEKHVPVIEQNGAEVTVHIGSAAHPMTDAHYIQWIYLETKAGIQERMLAPGQEPKASFALTEGDQVVAAYAYCNLHGLWKADAK